MLNQDQEPKICKIHLGVIYKSIEQSQYINLQVSTDACKSSVLEVKDQRQKLR